MKELATKALNLDIHLSNMFNTAFKGNTNQRVLQTVACTTFRTYYPTGKVDTNGRVVYEGIEVDNLNIIARAMNFSYIYQKPEPSGAWGALLPNGSWTAVIGEMIQLIILDTPKQFITNCKPPT
jgi:hypothetical protein